MGTYGSGLYGRTGATYGDLSLATIDAASISALITPFGNFEEFIPGGGSQAEDLPIIITAQGAILIRIAPGFYI